MSRTRLNDLKRRSLSLNRETVRPLGTGEMGGILGGLNAPRMQMPPLISNNAQSTQPSEPWEDYPTSVPPEPETPACPYTQWPPGQCHIFSQPGPARRQKPHPFR